VSHPIASALRAALHAAKLPGAHGPLEALSDSGLAHLHLRLVGTGWLARIPKQSQMGLAAAEHLRYEAACFAHAAASGHAPALHAVLPPSADLPRGALLVDEVEGRPLRLPQDLDALTQALARLHALPVPPPVQRSPLLDPADPLDHLAREIALQGQHLAEAGLERPALQRIEHERARFAWLLRQHERPPRHLIAFDAHPGNFLRCADGRAVLVDLEKARYGAAALDLAHATLYTSTTWDRHSHAVLDDAQVTHAAHHWLDALASAGVDAGVERAWIAPLRRAMWLWSITWCAKWRVQSGQARKDGGDGEDWSTDLSTQALVAHVRDRVDHYLSTAVVQQVCDQADALDAALSA
jgi:hypothetical protein